MVRALQPWSGWQELSRFRREFDELFNRVLGRGAASPEYERPMVPVVESLIDGNQIVVRADLPGIDPKDVEVTVTGNTMTIRGSRSQRHEEKGRDFIHREVSYGSFERSLTLPEGVQADQVKAVYRDGVLELTAPLPAQQASRKVPIEIEGDGSKQKVESGAKESGRKRAGR